MMKSQNIILKKQAFVFAIVTTIFLFSSSTSFGQQAKEVSVSLCAGNTFVNYEEALGYSDDYMDDWSDFHYSIVLRGFLLSEKTIHLGAEFAWQQLYYAYYRVPYGSSPVYREFNVTTISLMALGRYSSNNFFSIGGAGLHIFNDGVSPAICLEAGYMLSAGENLKVPVSLRLNPVFGMGTPTPISIGIGLSFR